MVPLEWLQMFDWKELQMLVSGASIPVDLTDLMENTRYGGMYSSGQLIITHYKKLFITTFNIFLSQSG